MKIVHAKDRDFESAIGHTEQLVLLEFWSPSCGPCRMIVPVLEELAKRHLDSLRVVMIDVTEATETSHLWRVRSTPTIVALRDREERARHSGAILRGQLIDWVESQL